MFFSRQQDVYIIFLLLNNF